MKTGFARWLSVLAMLFAIAACAPSAPTKPSDRPFPSNPLARAENGGGVLNRSCRTDADCAVKNVGNCCGYYPQCVNVNAKTDPAGVQANCAKRGMAGVCGFPSISSCSCVKGQCAANNAAL